MKTLIAVIMLLILVITNNNIFAEENKSDHLDNTIFGVSGGIGFDFVNHNKNLHFDFLMGKEGLGVRVNASMNLFNDAEGETLGDLEWATGQGAEKSKGVYTSSINFGIGYMRSGLYSFAYIGLAHETYFRNLYDETKKLGENGNYNVIKSGDTFINLSAEFGWAFESFFVGIGGSISYEEAFIKLGYYM